MSKNGYVGLIHPYSQNIINYIAIVSRVSYTPIQHVPVRRFHTCSTKIKNQSHMSALFSKAASSERCLPKYSLYLKEGSHDGVSNAQ